LGNITSKEWKKVEPWTCDPHIVRNKQGTILRMIKAQSQKLEAIAKDVTPSKVKVTTLGGD